MKGEPSNNTRQANAIVAHPGTHHSYMVALAFQEMERLEWYLTSYFYRTASIHAKLLGKVPWLHRRFMRRFHDSLDQDRVRSIPLFEIIEKACDRTFRRGQTDNRMVYWRDRRFDDVVSRRWLSRSSKLLIGYPNACYASFNRMRDSGGRCILDLPIGHFREAGRIFQEERSLHPEFADTITYSAFDQQYAERVDGEIDLADHVLVPSDFVRRTLETQGVESTKIVKIPYGSWLSPVASPAPKDRTNKALRVIYFGQVSQRKGIKYLFDAVSALREHSKPVTLTVVGQLYGKCTWLSKYESFISFRPAVARAELTSILAEHDVFVLPTLFEGSAYVIPEALSHALPVITTGNAGAESLVDGKNGYLVPLRDSESISVRLAGLADDRTKLDEMKAAALETSREITWDRYRFLLSEWITASQL